MRLDVLSLGSVDLVWDAVRPMLDRCVNEAAKGEITTDDIRQLVLAGDAVIVVGTDDAGEIDIVAALEPINYPRMRVLNLFALGGRPGCMERYETSGWIDELKSWAAGAGYQAIDAWTSKAMLRIVNRHGFRQQYIHSRCPIGEAK